MELGAGLITTQRRPDDDRTFEAIYDEALEYTNAAEEAGLASIWVSEHHFADDGYLPGVMPLLGSIAAETDRIQIGSCIALAPLYDPIRLAEDAATVSLVAGGRTTLGLGAGYVDEEFERFGVPKSERGERTADAAKVCRGAWSEGPLAHDSAFHQAPPDTVLTPKPEHPPTLMLGGSAKPAVRRAARLADAWCAPSSLSPEELKTRADDIERVRREEGLDGEFKNYALVHGFVGESEAEAWETVREGFLHMQRKYAEWYAGEPVELSDEQITSLKEQAIFGTPEQICSELSAYEDALGSDCHIIFRTYQPGIGTEEMIECLHRIGDEVLPAL
jgi:alkanesulfonate monooxygenase SsuD/methylene tetrahydromethanopterin reductase-like flavin-dependent oxidoreductase (luciferase family)